MDNLSELELSQYIDLVRSFLYTIKHNSNNSNNDFVIKMNTLPSKITQLFAKTPISDKILEHFGIMVDTNQMNNKYLSNKDLPT